MANNFISIKKVADSLLRHPMMKGISFEAIIDYTVDFMRIVQCGGFFGDDVATITIENYKGILPEDFFEINQVRLLGQAVKVPIYEDEYKVDSEGSVYATTNKNVVGYETKYESTNKIFTHASNTFHTSNPNERNLTYKIQGGYIFTSIKEGIIEISYQSILIDEDLYPMIPDNSKFTRALELYIKKQWFTILFDMGKLQYSILQNIQQEYAWAVGACESEFQKMTIDKAESFYNSWRTLIPRVNEHGKSFSTNNIRESLKLN
jgi:hypothetical protein